MGLDKETVRGSLRISWCHMTPEVDWNLVAQKINSLRR
jgi:cysteine desulfurase